MVINFYVRFKSTQGQSVAIKIVPIHKKDVPDPIEVPLNYLDNSSWHVAVKTSELGIADEFHYYYIFRDSNTGEEKFFCKNVAMFITKLGVKRLDIIDEWQDEYYLADIAASKPFATVFNQLKTKLRSSEAKSPTHIFRVKAPGLGIGKAICLAGQGKKLRDWDSENPLIFEQKKNYWQLKVNLSRETFPLAYKMGIYDIHTGKMDFAAGDNKQLTDPAPDTELSILHQQVDTGKHRFRAAGINVPVSALRTKQSWGVGQFTDLNTLADLAKETGLRLIQLLPINDTTATHTNKDSYPYSAVSAFALHPLYLDVALMAKHAGLELSEEMQQQARLLNEKETLQYEEVQALKREAIGLLYEKEKDSFKDDFGWFSFFDLNRHWLVPYAAYCYLRDHHKTADYNTWGEFASYSEDAVQELVSKDQPHYHEVAIHYYTQYHLHLQLRDAVDYAHKEGIILKGDLPIGVGRHSADAWMYRDLFHMDMQAGAPPDAFATKGQNWSFPTYNWEKMAADNYAWWRQRMENMGSYFDAIRIDHVLGFFRIWSIPLQAVEGILGKFVPSWPLSHHDIADAGVHFHEDRFCKPYITQQLLYDLFGGEAAVVQDVFLDHDQFKPQFDTQRKIADFVKQDPKYGHLLPGLLDLMSNVICLFDAAFPYNYHFRIAMQNTASFRALPYHEQQALNRLYEEYFFRKQNRLWEEEGIKKLTALKRSTDMLICAEDLGMVPEMVAGVLDNMHMLALEVQRMPKRINEKFSNPYHSPYLSVVTPSTHDMASIREWWEADADTTREFYRAQLGQHGDAPFFAEPWVCREIIKQHLQSPAMWAVFLMQDLLCMDDSLRIADPKKERINNPADPDHYWNYRMHLGLEDIMEESGFIVTLKTMIKDSGR